MIKSSLNDMHFMRKALNLAKRGGARVHPNPKVGAVLVKHKKIIGSGFHKCFGGPHAEVNAINSARQDVRGSDLYVTLEPCAHYGKTPPCTELIIEQGIRRVVFGAADPNPLVSGKSARILKKAGILVYGGILENECSAINEDYNHWMKTKMPYVIVKAAQSLDGKIATRTGQSQWISGDASRRQAHRLRSQCDAVMVGSNTIEHDNPSLSARFSSSDHQPLRVILDSRLRVSPKAKIFSGRLGGPVLLAITGKAPKKRKQLFRGCAEIVETKERHGRVDLRALLRVLANKGIVRLMIEGGGEVIAEVLEQKLAHEIYLFIAPKIIGGRHAISSVSGLGIADMNQAVKIKEMSYQRIGQDLLVRGRL